jgi:hypothetical protein
MAIGHKLHTDGKKIRLYDFNATSRKVYQFYADTCVFHETLSAGGGNRRL